MRYEESLTSNRRNALLILGTGERAGFQSFGNSWFALSSGTEAVEARGEAIAKGGEVEEEEGGEIEDEDEEGEEEAEGEMEREGVRKEEGEFSSLGITCSPQMRPRKSVPGTFSVVFGTSL